MSEAVTVCRCAAMRIPHTMMRTTFQEFMCVSFLLRLHRVQGCGEKYMSSTSIATLDPDGLVALLKTTVNGLTTFRRACGSCGRSMQYSLYSPVRGKKEVATV